MIIVLKIIFFVALVGILHTYAIYPALMLMLKKLQKRRKTAKAPGMLPKVEIVFAAYNEESVIKEKIDSSFKTSYPLHRLSVRVGSDSSTDKTDSIIEHLQKEYPGLHLKKFSERTGKSGILNDLVRESEAELLILTDANIIFTESTVPQLVQAIHRKDIGIVGGTIEYRQVHKRGISQQENTYLQLENSLKSAESEVFGAVMGVEGGCYIIRKDLFPTIPPLFFMEDFYISLSVLERGYKILFNREARCFEDVSVAPAEEYKRKVRISIGNFQNLGRFGGLILQKFFPVGFAFISHKVLRWLTPFFLIFLLISSVFLTDEHYLFSLFAGLYCIFLSAGLFGILFSREKGVSWLKYPGHFIYMNIALLKGFFIYLKGVKSNVWQPTSRNQK